MDQAHIKNKYSRSTLLITQISRVSFLYPELKCCYWFTHFQHIELGILGHGTSMLKRTKTMFCAFGLVKLNRRP